MQTLPTMLSTSLPRQFSNAHTSPHHIAYFEEATGGGWPVPSKESFLANDVDAGFDCGGSR
jgi:hypothetical protein